MNTNNTHETHAERTERDEDVHPFLRVAQGLAILCAFGIGITTFFGMRDLFGDDESLRSIIVPLCVSAVITAVIAGAWHQLLEEASDV